MGRAFFEIIGEMTFITKAKLLRDLLHAEFTAFYPFFNQTGAVLMYIVAVADRKGPFEKVPEISRGNIKMAGDTFNSTFPGVVDVFMNIGKDLLFISSTGTS
jgi:hypothetical protein